jgi:hypothetical protein
MLQFDPFASGTYGNVTRYAVAAEMDVDIDPDDIAVAITSPDLEIELIET